MIRQTTQDNESSIQLLYCYASEDGGLLQELKQHLALGERQGRIKTWHEGSTGPGLPWAQEFSTHLSQAKIVLLLISASFLASDHAYSQMEQILVARRSFGTRVIPILLQRVAWESAPFADLQLLPRNRMPVTAWSDRQEAWAEVTKSILAVVEELQQGSREQTPSVRVQAFDSQVAELYRLLHYEVEAGKVLAKEPFDLYLTRNLADINIRRVVACHPGPLTLRELEDFIRRFTAARVLDRGLLGTVVSGASFAADLVERAQAAEVQLITVRELSARLLEGRAYAERLLRELASDPKYPILLYIQPSIALDSGGGRAAPDVFQDWMSDPSWNQMTLLGDVGTGKTFLSRMLVHRLATNYLKSPVDHPLPILVDLRNADRQLSLEGLVLTQLHNHGLPQATFDVFQHVLSAGQIVLIFDGFDEMAARVTPQVTTRNFIELARCVRGRAKVLITCRTHYFKSRSDEELVILDLPVGADSGSELYWDLAIRKGFQIAYLRPFETWQIEEYVMKVKGDGAKVALQRIREIYNLIELSRRPMLLDMIVKSIDRLSEDTNAANLYEVFTKMWTHRDRWRDVLAPEQKQRILFQLAWHLWSKKTTTIHYKDLLDHLSQHELLHANDPAIIVDLDNEVRTASFLVRDVQGNYSFAHKSYAEFFLARHILRCLLDGDEACLDAGLLSPEVLGFFWQLASGPSVDAIRKRMEEILSGRYCKNRSENALLLIHSMLIAKGQNAVRPAPLPMSLPGAQLDGVNLEKLQASNANLRGASLIGANLFHANLSYADLEGVNLQSADLRNADLTHARMTRAYLQLANLEGAKLQGAVLAQADLTDANLIGADLTEVDLNDVMVRRLPDVYSSEADSLEPGTKPKTVYDFDYHSLLPIAQKEVRAAARGSGLPEYELEDLAADLVSRVYMLLSAGTMPGEFSTQNIRNTMRLAVLDTMRKRSSIRMLPLSEFEQFLPLPEEGNPDTLLLAQERLGQLARALETLDPVSKTLMQQTIKGQPLKEAAAQLGISEAIAFQRLSRARRRLREAIESEENLV